MTANHTIEIAVEVTDTFGGDANYSWVRRYQLTLPSNTSDRTIVRKAKAEAGWTNIKCLTEKYDSQFTLRPRGMCQIMFIDIIGE